MELKIPYMDDSQLPSSEQIKHAFLELDLLLNEEIRYKELKKTFLEKLSIFPQLICPDRKLNLPVYRTRIINPGELDIQDPASFSHPPQSCNLGRCNFQDHPGCMGLY